jgi:hypothetical protein
MDSNHCPRVKKLKIHALSDGFSDDFFIPRYTGVNPIPSLLDAVTLSTDGIKVNGKVNRRARGRSSENAD